MSSSYQRIFHPSGFKNRDSSEIKEFHRVEGGTKTYQRRPFFSYSPNEISIPDTIIFLLTFGGLFGGTIFIIYYFAIRPIISKYTKKTQ